MFISNISKVDIMINDLDNDNDDIDIDRAYYFIS